jgi:CheY-like chemotaxis protein
MSINVLLVEDDMTDAAMLKKQLDAHKIFLRMFTARDGTEAMDYLYQRGKWEGGWPRPNLVLLDWNLPPPVFSYHILQTLRDDQFAGIIPVIISKADNTDIELAAKEAGAVCVLQKPVTLQSIEQIVRAVEDYRFTVVRYTQ